MKSVLTPVITVHWRPPEGLDQGRDVARIGDEQIGRADHDRNEAVRLKGEHVVERQRRQECFALGADRRGDPGVDLLQIGDQVAMGQHRPLRHAGRPAGVLQKGDVGRLDRRFGERLPSSELKRAIETLRPLEAKDGDGATDATDDHVDDLPPRAAQLIARAGDHDGLDARAADRLFEDARKVLQHHDRFRARIGELMAKLARRIQGVAIDDDIARAERPEHGDRVLQQVRQHQRDAGAARQANHVLQVSPERARLLVQFAVRDRFAHADEGGPVAKLGDAGREKLA